MPLVAPLSFPFWNLNSWHIFEYRLRHLQRWGLHRTGTVREGNYSGIVCIRWNDDMQGLDKELRGTKCGSLKRQKYRLCSEDITPSTTRIYFIKIHLNDRRELKRSLLQNEKQYLFVHIQQRRRWTSVVDLPWWLKVSVFYSPDLFLQAFLSALWYLKWKVDWEWIGYLWWPHAVACFLPN